MFVFVDIETGGIPTSTYPLEDIPILEVAVVVTDNDLEEIDHKTVVISQPEYKLDAMNEWAKDQHESSGLIDEVRASTIDTGRATLDLASWLYNEHVAPASEGQDELVEPPMCGSSVHFDRMFINAKMPQFAGQFHYRNIDVSTLKELARRWGIPPFEFDGDKTHRALDDLRHTIAELTYYRTFIEVPE